MTPNPDNETVDSYTYIKDGQVVHDFSWIMGGADREKTDPTGNMEEWETVKADELNAIKQKNEKYRKEHHQFVDTVKEVTRIAMLAKRDKVRRTVVSDLSDDATESENVISDDDTDKLIEETNEYFGEVIEGFVWEVCLSLEEDKTVFDEVVDKMAYIHDHYQNAEAQLRGLFFEVISHRIAPNDSRVLTTVRPSKSEMSAEGREKTADELDQLTIVPVEGIRQIIDGRSIKIEKGIIIGETIREQLRELLVKGVVTEDGVVKKIKDAPVMLTAEQIKNDKTSLPEHGIYVYLPKIDGDKGSKIIITCNDRGIPYYQYMGSESWKLVIPKNWQKDVDRDTRNERTVALRAFEYYLREQNKRAGKNMTMPDGVIKNGDEVVCGVVETKCWYEEEVKHAIEVAWQRAGMTSNQVLINESDLETIMRGKGKENRDKAWEAVDEGKKKKIKNMDLMIKIAEELRLMEMAGYPKIRKVILRFPADVLPGEAAELADALKNYGEIYIQILPISADGTGKVASEILHSREIVKKLEAEYRDKKGDYARKQKLLKARCLALKQNYTTLAKAEQIPDETDDSVKKLWGDIKNFKQKK